jgi:hypothetical protein
MPLELTGHAQMNAPHAAVTNKVSGCLAGRPVELGDQILATTSPGTDATALHVLRE